MEGNPPKGEKCAVVKKADRVGNLEPIDIIHGESDFEVSPADFQPSLCSFLSPLK